jgi:hypothetical protein
MNEKLTQRPLSLRTSPWYSCVGPDYERLIEVAEYPSSLGEARRSVSEVCEQAATSRWFEWLARGGHVAKGVIYIVLGVLAARVAFGLGGQTTGKQGALLTILSQPFGQILLGLVAVGLVGYAIWRLFESLFDPEGRGRDLKAIGQRIGFFFSGLIYASLAFSALRLLLGIRAGDDQLIEEWTAKALGEPLGRWLVGIAGAIVIGAGVFQLYKAYAAKFTEILKWGEMSAAEHAWTTRLGRFGLAARGVVYGVIGSFLVRAALRFDSHEAGGSAEALAALARPPLGLWALGVVALGLAAYGAYMLAAARYSRIVRNT